MASERAASSVWARRLLLALMATALALTAVEGGLRLTHADLPSTAALADTGLNVKGSRSAFLVGTSHEAPLCGRVAMVARDGGFKVLRYGPAAGRALRLWVVGDSVTAGMGVQREQTYSAVLARALARRLDAPVELTIIGSPGGDYCTSLVRLHSALDRERPDLVLWQLFADDLVRWPALKTGLGVVRPPEYAGHPLVRALVSRSYLANLAWFALSPPPPLTRAARPKFVAGARALGRRVRAAGAALVVELLSPAGMPHCLDDPPPETTCAWMRRDMATMKRWLTEAGLPPIDHRTFWHGKPDVMLARERVALEGDGLPIHPNPAGHRLLAEALQPYVLKALKARTHADP